MYQLFLHGGPVMWPLLLTSIVALTVVIERLAFAIGEKIRRRPETVTRILATLEAGDPAEAEGQGSGSKDFVARTLVFALRHRHTSFSGGLLQGANTELRRYSRGLTALDTIITLAPLEGLFGTVTGMIRAFHLLGGSELGAPTAITGGIAEALIATAFGLLIAMLALLPFNYLNARLEAARHELESAGAQAELLLLKHKPSTTR